MIKGDQTKSDELITQYSMDKETTTFNAKVLLAEDNLVNQQVAKGVLRKLGCQVDLAINGTEAVSLMETSSYDIVFMDCQMPRMDGYAATGEIRRMELETKDSNRTPIIALTANALSGDRERCLAAGMDDYISKPFRKDRITEILTRWLTAQLQVVEKQTPPQNAPAPTVDSEVAGTDIIDQRALENIRTLQAEGAEDIIIIRWYNWAIRSQIDQVRKVAKTVKNHWNGILA